MLFAEFDVLHEGQLVDHRRGVVVAVEIGDDIGKMFEQGEVGTFVDLFVARLAGLKEDMLEGVIAVFTRLAFGMQKQRHVL